MQNLTSRVVLLQKVILDIAKTERFDLVVFGGYEQGRIPCKEAIRSSLYVQPFAIIISVMNTYSLIHNWFVVNFKILGNTEKCVDDFCPSDSGNLSLFMHERIVPVEFLSIQKVNEMFDRVGFQVHIVDVIYEAILPQLVMAFAA